MNTSVKQIDRLHAQNIIISYTIILTIVAICALVLLHTDRQYKLVVILSRGLAFFALLGLILMAFLAITI